MEKVLLTVSERMPAPDSCSEWMTTDPMERDLNSVTSVLPYDVHSFVVLGQNSTAVWQQTIRHLSLYITVCQYTTCVQSQQTFIKELLTNDQF